MLGTVVGDYINTKKTTFDFNFDLNQGMDRWDTYKHTGQ